MQMPAEAWLKPQWMLRAVLQSIIEAVVQSNLNECFYMKNFDLIARFAVKKVRDLVGSRFWAAHMLIGLPHVPELGFACIVG